MLICSSAINTWTESITFRGRCFGISAPNSDSSPKPKWTSDLTGHSELRANPPTSVSGKLNFYSTEEEPRHLEWTRQEESSSPKWLIEEELYLETENKLHPLASSTIIRGELWTEPRLLNSPIKNDFHDSYIFNRQTKIPYLLLQLWLHQFRMEPKKLPWTNPIPSMVTRKNFQGISSVSQSVHGC